MKKMATRGEGHPLTEPQIVHLAAAVSAKDLAAIVEGYMDITPATVQNLRDDSKP